MDSFGWKRKVGEKVSKTAAQQFQAESEEAANDEETQGVDWLHAIKRRRDVLLEDCASKSKRLEEEGALLATEGRHWEAVKKWDEAIQLTPDKAVLYEMKSQVLTTLQEVFPAVQAAEMAVKLHPLWWEAWVTLGRAQLNLGEVELAVRTFQVALHLHPSERPLWEEDLTWALKLRDEKRATWAKAVQEDEARRLVMEVPELQHDYEDFESDEVIAACTAIAERQKMYENLKKKAVVVDARGVAKEMTVKEPDKSSKYVLVKARIV